MSETVYFTGSSCSACNYPDTKLVELYNNGNSGVFTVLTERYSRLIRSVTSKYKISGLEAEDLTQEGLLGLLSAVKTYRADKGASFQTYAGVCINRRILTLLKRSDNNGSKALNNYVSLYDKEVEESVSLEVSNPEESFISEESFILLKKNISGCLSNRENRVLELYLAGESYSDIAANLLISVKAVDNTLQRIRKKLRKNISNMSL